MNSLMWVRCTVRSFSAVSCRQSLLQRYAVHHPSFQIGKISCTCITKQTARFSSNAPDDSVIYRGPLAGTIRMTKFLSLSSTAFGLAVQPYLLTHAAGAHVAIIVAVAGFVGFFTYVTPLLIHMMTKRYVVEMHYRPPSKENEQAVFTCTTISFFLRPKYMSFTAADVEIPDVPGVFTSVLVKKVPLLISPQHFIDLDAYKHLMGYDKPIDFHLNPNPPSPSQKTQG